LRAVAVGAMGYCGLFCVARHLGLVFAEPIARAYLFTGPRLHSEGGDLASTLGEMLHTRRFF